MIFGIAIIVIGIYGLPIGFEVNPEYINGILTASSILFGFWAVLIERQPKERTERFRYKILLENFFFSFTFLMLSVVMIYFAALNKLHSVFALSFCLVSFMSNAYFLAMTLYYYKFKRKIWLSSRIEN